MGLARIALPAILGMSLAFLLALPMARLRIRTGTWGVVVRESASLVERLVRWSIVVVFVALVTWTALCAALGPKPLAVWPQWPGVGWLGISIAAGGFALVAAAQAKMGRSWRIGIDDHPTALVTDGVFARIRHPIYTGIQSIVLGITCIAPSPWTLAGFALTLMLVNVQSRLEEQHLRQQHGAAFYEWASQVGRFVPRLGRLRPPGGARQ